MNLLSRFKPIKLIAMDVDGVLTDGTVYLIREFQQTRAMNIKDGYALQLAVKKGYTVAIISGAYDEGVENRLKKLGIEEIHLGIQDKAACLHKICEKKSFHKEEVLFIGDDIPDLKALASSGLACCPQDAVEEVKAAADYVSHLTGGKGCVRDIIEKVLKLNGQWDTLSGLSSI
jgi:3-deoxy-D-manno-octulosonate 8-phosphate phosphatase (KDO 8-P phosphatase)